MFSIIQTTRKLKFFKRSYVHLFYNSSQILKNRYLGRLKLVWHLYCKFYHRSLSNGMAFQSCSVLFTDPIDLLLACLCQINIPIPYWLPHAQRSFVRTSFQISTTSCMAQENFKDPIFIVNRIFLEGCIFFTSPPENIPTKFSRVSTWHITNVLNDRDIFTTKYFKPDTLSPPFWITQ